MTNSIRVSSLFEVSQRVWDAQATDPIEPVKPYIPVERPSTPFPHTNVVLNLSDRRGSSNTTRAGSPPPDLDEHDVDFPRSRAATIEPPVKKSPSPTPDSLPPLIDDEEVEISIELHTDEQETPQPRRGAFIVSDSITTPGLTLLSVTTNMHGSASLPRDTVSCPDFRPLRKASNTNSDPIPRTLYQAVVEINRDAVMNLAPINPLGTLYSSVQTDHSLTPYDYDPRSSPLSAPSELQHPLTPPIPNQLIIGDESSSEKPTSPSPNPLSTISVEKEPSSITQPPAVGTPIARSEPPIPVTTPTDDESSAVTPPPAKETAVAAAAPPLPDQQTPDLDARREAYRNTHPHNKCGTHQGPLMLDVASIEIKPKSFSSRLWNAICCCKIK